MSIYIYICIYIYIYILNYLKTAYVFQDMKCVDSPTGWCLPARLLQTRKLGIHVHIHIYIYILER